MWCPSPNYLPKMYAVSSFLSVVDLLYGGWWWLMLSLSLACVLFSLLLARADCDVVLGFYSSWGKQPKKVLSGKVVWVTGASSGIGENLCCVLAKCGALLVLSARREEELKRVLEQCKELSPEQFKNKHMVLPMDLMKTDKHPALVQKVMETFGKIDYLVNNAGRSQRAEGAATELGVDRAILELNVLSTLSLTKQVLPKMVENREGHLVIMSSVAGKIGAPGSASYSASKHALQGYFDTLRMELADKNISILSVCPGPVDTPFLHHIFTEKLSPSTKNTGPPRAGGNRVSAERCGQLIAVAMANNLNEVWIAKHPILLFVYLSQYFPNLAKWLGNSIGNKRLHAIKSGSVEVDKYL